jgi:rhodanese-related sulfurtransferase/biotin operon repressor
VDPALRTAALAHYEELARLGKAASSPIRLRLIDLLRQGPRSVEVLADEAGVSVANVSQHLQQLRSAHLVASEKQGQRIVYRLSSPEVGTFFTCLRRLGESLLPELDRLKDALQVQTEPERQQVLEKVAAGEATLLDVRPDEEWAAFHLPGAVHIPLGELPVRLDELPKDHEVIAYCRGPYCPMALAAVDMLRGAGFRAGHLDLGPADVAERRLALISTAPAAPSSAPPSSAPPSSAPPSSARPSSARPSSAPPSSARPSSSPSVPSRAKARVRSPA